MKQEKILIVIMPSRDEGFMFQIDEVYDIEICNAIMQGSFD
jgi:hypothetical protein